MVGGRIKRSGDTWPSHEDAIHFIDQLILDLKLQMFDEPTNKPIDMTRLEEWRKHRANLEQCQERRRFE